MAQAYQNTNDYEERVNQLAREIFIASGGKMIPSDTFTHAKLFINELIDRESSAKKSAEDRVQELMARSRVVNYSTGGV